jgi:putative protease
MKAHARGKQFFVASNLLPHNSKIKTYMADMEPVIAMKPDARSWLTRPDHDGARALAGSALFTCRCRLIPNQLHGCEVLAEAGCVRHLSRELSLDEIAEIRQECPDIELEVFVHGACACPRNRPLPVNRWHNHRSDSRRSTSACRWDYKMHDTQGDDAGDVQTIKLDFNKALEEANQSFAACGGAERHPLADKTYLIEEGSRPGELMPIIEDEHGTYIMNSKDLRAVEQVEKLVKIGVDSLKIEGRTKSLYYVARTAQVYRQAIDDAVAGRPFDLGLLAELEGLANRGYTPGFLERHQTQDYQNYLDGHSKAKQSQYVGDVLEVDADGWALIEVKNRFAVGDRIEVIHPRGNRIVQLTQMTRNGVAVELAAGNGMQVRIPDMAGMEKALLARLI